MIKFMLHNQRKMYGIIDVVETTFYNISEQLERVIDINETKLIYSTSNIEELKTKLGELLRRVYYKLLIFRVDKDVNIELLGYTQVFLYPNYQINKSYSGKRITEIVYDKRNKYSRRLLTKTLLSIDEVVVYLHMKDHLMTKNWFRKRFKSEFAKLGHKKTVWYRTSESLRNSYLEKYYLHLINRLVLVN